MEEYARPIMWNVPLWAEITLYAMIPLVMIALLAGAVWRVRKWFLGQAEPGTPTARQQLVQALQPKRLAELVKTALFQSRLSRDGFAQVMHQAIFWGMVFLAIGTALATVDQDFTNLLLDWQLLSGWPNAAEGCDKDTNSTPIGASAVLESLCVLGVFS